MDTQSYKNRFVAIDTEMPDGYGRSISAIGISVFENGEITESYYSLINPEKPFDPFIIELIGITPEMVKDAPKFYEYFETVKDVFEDSLIVAHGAVNDLKVISICLKRYGMQWKKEVPYVCTVETCCDCFSERKGYSLDSLCADMGIELDHHNPLSDSEACGKIFLKCIEAGVDVEKHIRLFDIEKGVNRKKRKAEPQTDDVNKPKKKKKDRPEPMNSESEWVREQLLSRRSKRLRKRFTESHPKIDFDTVIGIQTRRLITFEENYRGDERLKVFLSSLPHYFIEEDRLHAIIISNIDDPDEAACEIDRFLPYIKSKAIARLIIPKAFSQETEKSNEALQRWQTSGKKYEGTVAQNILNQVRECK